MYQKVRPELRAAISVAKEVFPYPMGPLIRVVPGASREIDSIKDDRERNLAGSRGGNVLESVTPLRIVEDFLSSALFLVATPKGDLNDGVREGQGECFRGETRVIYSEAKASSRTPRASIRSSSLMTSGGKKRITLP